MDSEKRVGRVGVAKEPRVILPRCDSPASGASMPGSGGGKRLESAGSQAGRKGEVDSDDVDSDVGLHWTRSRDSSPEGSVRKRRRGEGSFSSNEGDLDRRSPVWRDRYGFGGSRQLASRTQQREERRLDAQRHLEGLASEAERSRSALGYVPDDGDARTAEALHQRVIDDVAIITEVATKSMNLKGTVVRALKESAASIKAAVEVLRNRTVTEETAKLQADNSRLQRLLGDLRKEMADLRTELRREMAQASKVAAEPSPGRSTHVRMETAEPLAPYELEQLKRSIMLEVGGMMSARLEGLEGRLLPEKRLRPPLAADRKNAASAAAVAAAARGSKVEVRPPPPEGGPSTAGAAAPEKSKPQKGKGKAKDTVVPSAAAPSPTPKKAAPRPLPPAPVSTDTEWTTVVKRGAKKKAKQAAAAPAPAGAAAAKPSAKQASVKLRPPRSAAVVITLQPGAEDKGVSYLKVLQEARAKIDLASCGITSGLRFKTAITGGRILEVPGASSGGKADIFAQKIREVVDPELVKVSRPEKCADLRISGLDDSVSAVEVVAAIARRGACPEGSVKAGELRTDSQGFSTVRVSCPVAAAQRLGKGGRLLVGWTSAQVKLLQPRPLQCFRCLHKGHVRALCSAEVDRSDECYRCGQSGHRAAGCSAAAPRCSLCAAAKKPADHRVGSGKCSPPPPRQARAARAAGPSHPPTQGGEEAMDASPSH